MQPMFDKNDISMFFGNTKDETYEQMEFCVNMIYRNKQVEK